MVTAKMKVYKILHRKTGLYSRGGTSVHGDGRFGWSKNGKIWDTIGKLRSHITSHLPNSYRKGTNMSDWQVVTYDLAVNSVNEIHEVVSSEKIIQVLTSNNN